MALPNDFQFSQGSLQDYVECPRRFQLWHVLRMAWPALEAEPALENERYLRQGAAFHRLVHQHQLGIPAERLSATASDRDLARWWQSYLAHAPADLPAARYPETVLSIPLGEYRLVARYDLVAIDPGQRAVIVDWKTARRRPRRERLMAQLQTRVYPTLLVRAGADLNGGRPLAPEQVEMVYWFANEPTEPERFAFTAEQDAAHLRDLEELVAEIAGLDEPVFPLTSDERRCRICRYRSLCRRGVGAGSIDEASGEPDLVDDWEPTLDFEQIAEVEY